MIKKIMEVIKIIMAVIFSVIFGLFLPPVVIWIYFKLFSPIPRSLENFFITVGIFAALILAAIIFLFIKKKHLWAIVLLGTALMLGFWGVPMFILENNNELWLEKVFRSPGPAYFVEYSPDMMNTLKYLYDLHNYIWYTIRWVAYPFLLIYIGSYFYLRRARPLPRESLKKPVWGNKGNNH